MTRRALVRVLQRLADHVLIEHRPHQADLMDGVVQLPKVIVLVDANTDKTGLCHRASPDECRQAGPRNTYA